MESEKGRKFTHMNELSPGDIILASRESNMFHNFTHVLIGTPTNAYNGNARSRLTYGSHNEINLNFDAPMYFHRLDSVTTPISEHKYIPMAEVPDLSMAMLMYARRRLLLGTNEKDLSRMGVSPEQVLEDIDKILKTPFSDKVHCSLDRML